MQPNMARKFTDWTQQYGTSHQNQNFLSDGTVPCKDEPAAFDEDTVPVSRPCTDALHCFIAASMAANVSCGLPSEVRSRDKTQNCAASHIAQYHSKWLFRSIYTKHCTLTATEAVRQQSKPLMHCVH